MRKYSFGLIFFSLGTLSSSGINVNLVYSQNDSDEADQRSKSQEESTTEGSQLLLPNQSPGGKIGPLFLVGSLRSF